MTAWDEVFSDIRTDLKDTSATPRWSDDSIFLWTKDAVRDYSLYLPLVMRRVELTLSGSSYPLPVDYLQDIYVECPRDNIIEMRMDRPGTKFSTVSVPSRYMVEGGQLYLNASPLAGDEVLLSYYARHTLPTAYSDTSVITVPDDDMELIRLYVKAKAAEQLRTQQAALDRFKLGSGDRDDNPLLPEYEILMSEYRNKIAERIGGGVVLLYRPGRTR